MKQAIEFAVTAAAVVAGIYLVRVYEAKVGPLPGTTSTGA